MLREDLGHIVTSALDCLVASGELPEAVRGPVEISDTKQPEHGDYACNFALAAAKKAGMNPRELAEKLRSMILEVDEAGVDDRGPSARKMVSEGSPPHRDRRPAMIHEIEIAGPGFLNFRLKPEAVSNYLSTLLQLGPGIARAEPRSFNVEFVSVNPNGPITVGSGRGAAFGDSLCRVLEAAGNKVHREYYINDGVNSEQMRLFAESVRHYYEKAAQEASGSSRATEFEFPEKGYRGEYVEQVGRSLFSTVNPKQNWDEVAEQSIGWWQQQSQAMMLLRQREDLHAFGVDFDTWFSEQSLHDSGEVDKCIAELIDKGAADEEPYRTVLKMAKGGVIESAERQPQTQAMEEDAEVGPATLPLQEAEGTPSHMEAKETLWLRSTKFGDDMDRVLQRRDGRLTYIASDVAYHKDKLTDESGTRGTGPVDKLITILGPDHHGYIHRLQAVVAALLEPHRSHTERSLDYLVSAEHWDEVGGSEAIIFDSPIERDTCKEALDEARRKLEVVIFQIVRFVKDGKPAPMRKRDGNIYELRDLITELGQAVAANATKEEQQRIGADVARFFYLMRSHETHMDFDIDLATKQSDENPVFYVQYAHARICSVIRKAAEAGIRVFGYWGIEDGPGSPNIATPQHLNTSLLTHPRELALIKKILDLPSEVKRSAEDYGIHRLTTYAIELARTYHHFYDACRVIQADQPELSQARLALCEAARVTLKSTLELLGVSAPERMERDEPAS